MRPEDKEKQQQSKSIKYRNTHSNIHMKRHYTSFHRVLCKYCCWIVKDSTVKMDVSEAVFNGLFFTTNDSSSFGTVNKSNLLNVYAYI